MIHLNISNLIFLLFLNYLKSKIFFFFYLLNPHLNFNPTGLCLKLFIKIFGIYSLEGADWLLFCWRRRDWVKGILGPKWLDVSNHWLFSDWLLHLSVNRKRRVSPPRCNLIGHQMMWARHELWRNLLNPLGQICENTRFKEGKTGKIWNGLRENKSAQLSILFLNQFLFVSYFLTKIAQSGWIIWFCNDWKQFGL